VAIGNSVHKIRADRKIKITLFLCIPRLPSLIMSARVHNTIKKRSNCNEMLALATFVLGSETSGVSTEQLLGQVDDNLEKLRNDDSSLLSASNRMMDLEDFDELLYDF
jgi:hypothetical protein